MDDSPCTGDVYLTIVFYLLLCKQLFRCIVIEIFFSVNAIIVCSTAYSSFERTLR